MIREFVKQTKRMGLKQQMKANPWIGGGQTLKAYFSQPDIKIDKDVQEKIMELARKFLEKTKSGKIETLTPQATFEELGLDSLDAVDFIVDLEANFGFDISNEDAENKIRSVNDAVVVFSEYVARKNSEKASE
jgi:acyl carrier protein